MELPRINDIHIHLGYSPDVGRLVDMKELLQYREIWQIDKAVIFGHDSNEVIEMYIKNDWLYGLYWMHKTTDPEDLAAALENPKILGLKYHGYYNETPVTSLRDTILNQLKGKILMVHCGRYLEGASKSNTSYKHAVEVAEQYPDIKVVLAHMGGTDTTICKKAIDAAEFIPNLYFDTSGITTPYIIEYANNKIPITRIIFGSDIPWCAYAAMVLTVGDAMVSDLAKKDILHDNFELLLR